MLKFMGKALKSVIGAVFLLYAYNLIAVSIGLVIPINVYTVLLVSVLGFPGMIGLALFLIFIF